MAGVAIGILKLGWTSRQACRQCTHKAPCTALPCDDEWRCGWSAEVRSNRYEVQDNVQWRDQQRTHSNCANKHGFQLDLQLLYSLQERTKCMARPTAAVVPRELFLPHVLLTSHLAEGGMASLAASCAWHAAWQGLPRQWHPCLYWPKEVEEDHHLPARTA